MGQHLFAGLVSLDDAPLERSFGEQGPKVGFLGRVIFELLLETPDPDELVVHEPHGGVGRPCDLEQYHRAGVVVPFVDRDLHLWVEGPHQPVFQFLVALPGLAGLKGRADDVLRPVLDAPHHVPDFSAVQRRRVGEGGQGFADHPRIGVVVLPLDPLRLPRQSEEFDEQVRELGWCHASAFLSGGAPLRASGTFGIDWIRPDRPAARHMTKEGPPVTNRERGPVALPDRLMRSYHSRQRTQKGSGRRREVRCDRGVPVLFPEFARRFARKICPQPEMNNTLVFQGFIRAG